MGEARRRKGSTPLSRVKKYLEVYIHKSLLPRTRRRRHLVATLSHSTARSMCADGTLTVGVTSDSMLKKKSNANMVSSLSERLEGVTDFLRCVAHPSCIIHAEFSGVTLLLHEVCYAPVLSILWSVAQGGAGWRRAVTSTGWARVLKRISRLASGTFLQVHTTAVPQLLASVGAFCNPTQAPIAPPTK